MTDQDPVSCPYHPDGHRDDWPKPCPSYSHARQRDALHLASHHGLTPNDGTIAALVHAVLAVAAELAGIREILERSAS